MKRYTTLDPMPAGIEIQNADVDTLGGYIVFIAPEAMSVVSGVEPMGKLKGLEWERDGGPYFAYAYNDAFRYSVRQTQLGCFWVVRGAAGKLGGTKCDSIEHGKQVCFEDYQRRVRELFETTEGEGT